MNNKIFNYFMFTVGAAIGSAVTWKVVKTKYEQIANEEIASVKEEYSYLMTKMKNKLKENVNKIEEEDGGEHCPDYDERDFTSVEKEQVDYYKLSSKYRSDDENDEKGDEGDGDEVLYVNGPYVISPDEFSISPPGFNAQALNYFADGILADDWGYTLDVEKTIGEDSLKHFGEYTDDIVYVRNERTEIDYEVTKDPRTYGEAIRTNPHYDK